MPKPPRTLSRGPTRWPSWTEWREFRSPDFEVVKSSLRTPVIFDGRNIYEPAQMQRYGFVYFGVGRGAAVERMA